MPNRNVVLSRGNNSIEFDNTAYVLNSIDLGDVEQTFNVSDVLRGKRYLSSKLESRTIMLNIYVLDPATNMAHLNDVLVPFEKLYLSIDSYYIPVYLMTSVRWSTDYETNNNQLIMGKLSLMAMSPYYRRDVTTSNGDLKEDGTTIGSIDVTELYINNRGGNDDLPYVLTINGSGTCSSLTILDGAETVLAWSGSATFPIVYDSNNKSLKSNGVSIASGIDWSGSTLKNLKMGVNDLDFSFDNATSVGIEVAIEYLEV